MDQKQMQLIVEQYNQKSESDFGEITIKRVADRKTVFVEQIGEMGRSIIMTEHKADGKTYWAGYSSRTNTVYLSLAA